MIKRVGKFNVSDGLFNADGALIKVADSADSAAIWHLSANYLEKQLIWDDW